LHSSAKRSLSIDIMDSEGIIVSVGGLVTACHIELHIGKEGKDVKVVCSDHTKGLPAAEDLVQFVLRMCS